MKQMFGVSQKFRDLRVVVNSFIIVLFAVDNRSKRRREKGRLFQDFSGFALQYHEQTAHKISPQLALAAFQFLSSSIDLFKPELISTNVLRRLMQQSQIIRFIRVNKNADKSDHNPAETFIFQQVNTVANCKIILT